MGPKTHADKWHATIGAASRLITELAANGDDISADELDCVRRALMVLTDAMSETDAERRAKARARASLYLNDTYPAKGT